MKPPRVTLDSQIRSVLPATFERLYHSEHRERFSHRKERRPPLRRGRNPRDQEDTAGLFKRLFFAGVDIVTLAEGDITHLHIGFKGTMNALFLKDLAEKTRRGLRGRVESGKAGGGLCNGYRVVKSLAGGTLTTGERAIEPGKAAPSSETKLKQGSSGLSSRSS